MKSVVNRTVWITGASSGIGKAMAAAFNQAGAHVILSARRTEVLKEVASNLPYPEHASIVALDLSESSRAKEWTQKALQSTGQIDLLVNNGGLGHMGSVEDMEFDVEHQVMEVNLWGAVAITKAVLPHMRERGSGQIWTVASILGFFGSPKLAAYAASKFAVVGYFESLQYELANSPIHIGLLSPGFVNTNVTLSSLGPDGKPIGTNSVAQENGMLPERLAERFLKHTMRSRPKKHLIIGGYERFAVPFKRHFPRLFFLVYGKLTDVTRKKNS